MLTRTRTIIGVSGMALAAATVLGAATPALAAPDSSGEEGLTTIGLTRDDRLVQFNTNTPRKIRVLGKVSGLQDGDTNVVGIDYRVQDSQLYGVGDKGGIYRIVEATAVATKVSQLTVPLEGSSFGVDFNPAANALRVVSETGQNLRHPFATFTGAFFTATTAKDGTLTYPATAATAATVATGVTGAAYTNNDLDMNTSTSLFDLDTVQNQIVLQSPANSGLLAATGKLRQDPGTSAGFDICSKIRGDRAVELRGYATLSVGGKYRLYDINILSGEATFDGTFRPGTQVEDLAMKLNEL